MQSFLALGDLMLDNDVNRDKFSKCVAHISIIPENSGVPSQKPPPGKATDSLNSLNACMVEKQPYRIRVSALYTFKSLF